MKQVYFKNNIETGTKVYLNCLNETMWKMKQIYMKNKIETRTKVNYELSQ